MRPFTGLTLIGSFLLGAPDALWLANIPANMLWLIHALAFSLTVRLLFLCATVARSVHDVLWVGAFSAAIGGLVSQLILHTPLASMRLAGAMAAYSSLGLRIYQLDEASLVWPFVLIALTIAFYTAVAYVIFRLVHARRRRWLESGRMW